MIAYLYVVFAIAVITVVAIGVTILREKRRASQLSEIAVRLGFSYTADGRSLLAEGLGALPLFVTAQLPRQSEIRNVLGKRLSQAKLFICDYHYWTGGSGSTRFDHHQTVACFRFEQGVLPDFTLHPRPSAPERNMLRAGFKMASVPAQMGSSSFRGALTTMLESLEEEGVQFADHPDFTRRYWLKSAEEASGTRALFKGELIGFLQAQTVPLCVESAGRWLAVYRRNTKVKPEEIGSFSEDTERVLVMLLKPKDESAFRTS